MGFLMASDVPDLYGMPIEANHSPFCVCAFVLVFLFSLVRILLVLAGSRYLEARRFLIAR